jgi:hypothetical protein
MVVTHDKKKKMAMYWVGDKVWLYIIPQTNKKKGVHKKLCFPWQRSYVVLAQVTPNIVKLKMAQGNRVKQKVHVNRLKQYHEQGAERPSEEPKLDEEDTFDYELEKVVDQSTLGKKEAPPEDEQPIFKIVAYRIMNVNLQYQVEWEDGDKTWQSPESEQTTALDNFFASRQHELLFGLEIKMKWLAAVFAKRGAKQKAYNFHAAKEKLEQVFREFYTNKVEVEKIVKEIRNLYAIGEVRDFTTTFLRNFKQRTRGETESRGIGRATKDRSRNGDEEEEEITEKEKSSEEEEEETYEKELHEDSANSGDDNEDSTTQGVDSSEIDNSWD